MTVYQHSLLDEDSNEEQTARFQGILDVMIQRWRCALWQEGLRSKSSKIGIWQLTCSVACRICKYVLLSICKGEAALVNAHSPIRAC
jgi:hypothetical protein